MRQYILPLSCSFCLGLTACQPAEAPGQFVFQTANTQVQGHVIWPDTNTLRVQADLTEIQSQATVSLIYPGDHATLPNHTVATGLTTAEGDFVINPDVDFMPETNSVFILEASKRLGGPSNDLLSVRTLILWTGSSWNSITGTSVKLDALTTAIALMAHHDNSIAIADTIGSAPSSTVPSSLGGASASDIEDVRDLVNSILGMDKDPNHYIAYNGGEYQFAIANNTLFGHVYDDLDAPLTGVTITATSLNPGTPFTASTTTAGGAYAFNNVPAGVQIEITATHPGFTPRRRVEVVQDIAEPNVNRYDFGSNGAGGNGSINNALSDKPEVIYVTPVRNASGVAAHTSFVVQFSEAMDKESVEDAFAIRAFNTLRLTADQANATTSSTLSGNGTIGTWNGSAGIGNAADGTTIWDKDAFNISWNPESTEATFAFKDERQLPSDQNSSRVPSYRVSFASFNEPANSLIRDASGIGRNAYHFKLTDGAFEDSYMFTVQTDTSNPSVTHLVAQTDENGGINGDSMRVRFSERMILYTHGVSIAGGMELIPGLDTKAPAAYPGAGSDAQAIANNYFVSIISGNTRYAGSWGALGGRAVYDTNDPTHKTVLLLPPEVYRNDVQLGAISDSQTLTGLINFTDGSSIPFDFTANNAIADDANTGLNLAAALNTAGRISQGTFSSGAFIGSGNGSAVRLQLASGASFDDGNTIRSIAFVSFTGGNAGTNPGTLTGKSFMAGATADLSGTRLDLYYPGDIVQVNVANTVIDPAGNTIDPNNDSASANAS